MANIRIVIIKLGAKGDVVRTLPILEALKKKYKNCEITWITKENALEIFNNNRGVDKLVAIEDEKEVRELCNNKEFDLLINLDVEKEACSLADKIKADEKKGFFLDESGYAMAYNLGAEYYLSTIFSDDLKKANTKTYQEMMFSACDLVFEGEKPHIYLSEKEKEYREKFIADNNLEGKRIIGIHIGSGKRWPSKSWHVDNIVRFIQKAKKKGYEIILFSGLEDEKRNMEINRGLDELNINICHNNPNNTDREFYRLINVCDCVVSGDSYAMHVSMALGKKTVGLFFCTSPWEVESYDLLTKITSSQLNSFFPERMNVYDEELTKSIGEEEVLKAIKNCIS